MVVVSHLPLFTRELPRTTGFHVLVTAVVAKRYAWCDDADLSRDREGGNEELSTRAKASSVRSACSLRGSRTISDLRRL